MTALHDLPATELLAAYQKHELSPMEVMQSVIDHVNHWEPQLGATYLYRPEQALAQARLSEARWQKNQPAGLLDGVAGEVELQQHVLQDVLGLGGVAHLAADEVAQARALPRHDLGKARGVSRHGKRGGWRRAERGVHAG